MSILLRCFSLAINSCFIMNYFPSCTNRNRRLFYLSFHSFFFSFFYCFKTIINTRETCATVACKLPASIRNPGKTWTLFLEEEKKNSRKTELNNNLNELSVIFCLLVHIDYIIVYLMYTFRYTPFISVSMNEEKKKLSTQFHFPQFILFNECLSHLAWHMKNKKKSKIEIERREKKKATNGFLCSSFACSIVHFDLLSLPQLADWWNKHTLEMIICAIKFKANVN